jgi:hypothetical protein
MIVTPNTQFTAVLESAPTGLAGTVGVRIIAASDDSLVVPRTTTGIVEANVGSGVYEVQLTSPAAQGDYLLIWDTGVVGPDTTTAEELTVVGARPTTITSSGAPASVFRTLPQANALLTEVRTHGLEADWDATETSVARWTGQVDAWVRRVDNREQQGERSSVVRSRVVVLPQDTDIVVGDLLTIVQGDETTQYRARQVEPFRGPLGVGGTVRVTAEDL